MMLNRDDLLQRLTYGFTPSVQRSFPRLLHPQLPYEEAVYTLWYRSDEKTFWDHYIVAPDRLIVASVRPDGMSAHTYKLNSINSAKAELNRDGELKLTLYNRNAQEFNSWVVVPGDDDGREFADRLVMEVCKAADNNEH